ncbi:hypothetical protein INT43_001959 [Umbelopsis isabellina]|uniref:Peroxin/Ferlin domain-containing protein n=1 Tax=Mortierella isabellina TaxID=91625 RepID=A0A8H7UH99_MORIS|nr:hypothetical protein INT43_001959 [Umbelopsis isabellina]
MGDERSSIFTDSDRESLSRFSTRSEVSGITSSRQDRRKKSGGFDSDTNASPLRAVEDLSLSKPPTPTTGKSHRKVIQQQFQDSMAQATLNGVWNHNIQILSPRATGKVFSKFVSRATPITHAFSYINNVYQWQQPVVSFSYLILWTLLCLYPSLTLLISPLIILLIFPQLKSEKSLSNALLPTCTDETSQQYFQNMKTTQDILTSAILLHDNLTKWLSRIDRYNSKISLIAFTSSCLISSLIWMFGRELLILAGMLVLVRHTRVWIIGQKLLGVVLEAIQTLIDIASHFGLVKTNPARAADPKTIEISVFENQRWWAGNGFTGQLLRAERKPWTNLTGAEPLVAKEDLPPPKGYRWLDSEWKLDRMVEPDDEGWVYTDHKWENERRLGDSPEPPMNSSASVHSQKEGRSRSLTRRRRWYRTATKINKGFQ